MSQPVFIFFIELTLEKEKEEKAKENNFAKSYHVLFWLLSAVLWSCFFSEKQTFYDQAFLRKRNLIGMECYATHLWLWRAVRYCRKLWLPLPSSLSLQLPQVKFKMFELSPLSNIKESVEIVLTPSKYTISLSMSKITHTYSSVEKRAQNREKNTSGDYLPYTCPKRDSNHRSREKSIIRPLLYLQATTAG